MTAAGPMHSSIAAAFVRACRLDVSVRKPGNVSRASAGHGMQAEQFVASALAAAPALCRPGAPVGARIEAAVQASLAVAGCNTNLGILLLCAPLAAAAEQPGALADAAALQAALQRVLAALGPDDAAACFRAIARANPGGLGQAPEADVRDAPPIGLVQAMALAAHRDSIARQYAEGYADLFGQALPLLQQGSPSWATGDADAPDAQATARVQALYLHWLAGWPDSHIVRRQGLATALDVQQQARAWIGHPQPDADHSFHEWDDSLKAGATNPGTTADLTVASLFAAGMLASAESGRHARGGMQQGCGPAGDDT